MKLFFYVLIVFLFSSCADNQPKSVANVPENRYLLQEGLKIKKDDNQIAVLTKKGILLMQEGRYEEASKEFQKALKLDIQNSSLHFLNALTYHFRSLNGDKKMLELAEVGYKIALKFEPSNYLASYLLGHIYFEKKDYKKAQNQFANELLYDKNNKQLLKSLATASYYAKDMSTFYWAAKKAYEIDPKDKNILRDYIFAKASFGEFDDASILLEKYKQLLKDEKDPFVRKVAYKTVDTRLQGWKNAYLLAQNDNIFGGDESKFQNDFVKQQSDSYSSDAQSDDTAVKISSQNIKNKKHFPYMTLVDVVIIKTQEVRTENKGINLLQGLTGTLGGIGIEYDSTKKTNKFSANPIFTFVGLEYNLNIFNDGSSRSNIIARPSLLAIDGKKSTFYAGDVLHVQLSSNNSDGSMIDIPIGIELDVLPKFYSKDIVQITVHAHRSFLETTSEKVGFTSFSQTSKTSVDATAILKFGETLILSGLTENNENENENGVPFLQDLPGIQYVTSNEQKLRVKTSILILLTPREVRYVNANMGQKELMESLKKKQKEQNSSLKALKHKNGIKVSNIDIVLGHLSQNSPFYEQFRKGDLNLDDWNNEDTILGSLVRALGFLYY